MNTEQNKNLLQKKKVLFLHIPKAGGSTLISILKKIYSAEKVVHVWSNGKVKNPIQLKMVDVDSFDLVVGHFSFGIHKFVKSPIQYITVLREPIERLISHYNYAKRYEKHYLHNRIVKNKIHLANYLLKPRSTELDNGQVRMLISSNKPIGAIDHNDFEEARQNLLNFFIFGTLENWNATLQKFKLNLDWPEIPEYLIENSTKQKTVELSEKQYQRIKEINKYDIALYNFVKNNM